MRFASGLLVLLGVAAAAAAQTSSNSLYQPASYLALTSDVRPRHVGDLITVMVYETSSASSSANTSAGRDAGVGLTLQGTGKSYSAGVKANNQLDGTGHTERGGQVLAQITVTIKEITERGDLVIAGEQLLEVNNEKQQIKVEGRVRPQDVSDANVVLSTRVANAKISYVGQGDLANVQRPAWWQRFVTLFGI